MKSNNKNTNALSTEAKRMESVISSMSNFKVKTKEIISESLRPASKKEEIEPNLLNENNLLDEL